MNFPKNSNEAIEIGNMIRGDVKQICAWVALRFKWDTESRELFLNPGREDEAFILSTRSQLAREVVETAIK